jgi:hypothetical protein
VVHHRPGRAAAQCSSRATTPPPRRTCRCGATPGSRRRRARPRRGRHRDPSAHALERQRRPSSPPPSSRLGKANSQTCAQRTQVLYCPPVNSTPTTTRTGGQSCRLLSVGNRFANSARSSRS